MGGAALERYGVTAQNPHRCVCNHPRPPERRTRRFALLSRSVVCDPVEAEQALAWAREHPAWTEDPPPLVIENPNDDRG